MTLYYCADGVAIYLGDCREILPRIAEADADCVVTDPPYGDTQLSWDERATGWVPALDPVLKPDASLWFFTSLRHLLTVWPEFTGWRLAEDIVWEKHNGTNLRRDRFRRVHEHAVHLYRGRWDNCYRVPPRSYQDHERVVRKQGRPAHWLGATGSSVFTQAAGMTKLMRSVIVARSMHRKGHHPTQKPIEITAPLVECSCPIGGLVVDPFMGSGTTLVAAKRLGRRAIGIELDERYCEIAARRLGQQVADLVGVGADLSGGDG
jgi:site-specific DNA-methyltransferase (adenine-specific)